MLSSVIYHGRQGVTSKLHGTALPRPPPAAVAAAAVGGYLLTGTSCCTRVVQRDKRDPDNDHTTDSRRCC